MKARNSANAYPPEVQAEVSAACRENRPIVLPGASLEKLGHGRRSPTKAMRAFCVDCMGGNRAEVRRCGSVGCALWPYRMGRNPFRGRKNETARPGEGRVANTDTSSTDYSRRGTSSYETVHQSISRGNASSV